MIKAYAAQSADSPLEAFEYDPGPLGNEDVELEVTSCGICHSDLSVLKNEWGFTKYPVVPGHEVIGIVREIGSGVTRVKVGDTVGLGWFSRSCMTCSQCMSGDHNMCAKSEGTIVGRHGGFADRVRSHEAWAVPIPAGLDAMKAGPLFCGGLTVFNPIVQFNVQPTDRVGVIGIGGLGHLALQFLRAWGCHVTAFTSSESKMEEAQSLGAHEAINSKDPKALRRAAGRFDFIISTVNVSLDWNAYLGCLAPRGRLHHVGAVLEPLGVSVFSMMPKQASVSSSPLGSPATAAMMLEFCERHDIAPVVEVFPVAKINEAIAHLESGKARYRVVLDMKA
ncbi:MAG: NAD(P)-dependent alcohol dehydrogenase [bacterium]|nr:NAD(P)-dependent alcohol dehydrogenase [bacterium]